MADPSEVDVEACRGAMRAAISVLTAIDRLLDADGEARVRWSVADIFDDELPDLYLLNFTLAGIALGAIRRDAEASGTTVAEVLQTMAIRNETGTGPA